MFTEALDLQSLLAAGRQDGPLLPADTRIGHVHLSVADLAHAERFYAGRLGFRVTQSSYPGALFMSAGGYHHHLGTNSWAPGPAAGRDEARLLNWELIVPTGGDVEAVAENLRRNGQGSEKLGAGIVAEDPWKTRVHILPEG